MYKFAIFILRKQQVEPTECIQQSLPKPLGVFQQQKHVANRFEKQHQFVCNCHVWM